MALQCGIVGLPNVGKSSLFNALTQSSVPAENYPFCTIDPHLGIVELPDFRLLELKKFITQRNLQLLLLNLSILLVLLKALAQERDLVISF